MLRCLPRTNVPQAVYYFSVLTFPTLERAPNVSIYSVRTACLFIFQYVNELVSLLCVFVYRGWLCHPLLITLRRIVVSSFA